jgi:hypothetical protein
MVIVHLRAASGFKFNFAPPGEGVLLLDVQGWGLCGGI